MAQTFTIEGPSEIFLSETSLIDGSNSWTTMGYTDNNDLFGFELEQFSTPVLTTAGGQVPQALINNGAVAHLNFTMVKWDVAEVEKIMLSPGGGATEGSVGQVGAERFAGATSRFGLRVIGAIYTYTFGSCYIDGRGSVRVMDFGNRPKRVAISCTAVPKISTSPSVSDVIYTKDSTP